MYRIFSCPTKGDCGQAIVLGNFQYRGVLLNSIMIGQGPTVLTVGTRGGCLNIFLTLSSLFFLPLSGRRLVID